MNTIHWHYSEDKQLIEDASFMEWFAKLKTETSIETGYSGPLEESTGMMCWHEYYNENFSPQETAAEDMSYWESEPQ